MYLLKRQKSAPTGELDRVASIQFNNPKKFKGKRGQEYLQAIAQLWTFLIENNFEVSTHLGRAGLLAHQLQYVINPFRVFQDLVKDEYFSLKGDLNLLLRNDSLAVSWLKSIVESHSSEMFLFEKRVIWLVNKYSRSLESTPVRSPQASPQQPKQKGFFAPSIALHQQIIQKEESPSWAGTEWLEEAAAARLLSPDVVLEYESHSLKSLSVSLLFLTQPIVNLAKSLGELNSVCWEFTGIAAATSAEVTKLCGTVCSPSVSAPEEEEPEPEPKKKGFKKKKEKRRSLKSSKDLCKRDGKLRRNMNQDEAKIHRWTVTNVILLHFAVPIVASRFITSERRDKNTTAFARLLARLLMKVATGSLFEGEPMNKYNSMMSELQPAFVLFSQDLVESGSSYVEHLPVSTKKYHYEEIRVKAEAEIFKEDALKSHPSEIVNILTEITRMCEAILKAGKIVSTPSGSRMDDLLDESESDPNHSEKWMAPSPSTGMMPTDHDFYDESDLSSSTMTFSSPKSRSSKLAHEPELAGSSPQLDGSFHFQATQKLRATESLPGKRKSPTSTPCGSQSAPSFDDFPLPREK